MKGNLFHIYLPLKLSKGGKEIVQACDFCFMPGFCASIVLAFISGVELFYYVVDGGGGGGICESQTGGREGKWGI